MKTLRLTTTKPMGFMGIFRSEAEQNPPLVAPTDIGKIIPNGKKSICAYIHGDAQELAGFDIPTFIDGNISQLDMPVEQQDILLMLPMGNYKCKAEVVLNKYNNNKPQYHITLKK